MHKDIELHVAYFSCGQTPMKGMTSDVLVVMMFTTVASYGRNMEFTGHPLLVPSKRMYGVIPPVSIVLHSTVLN